MDGVIRQLAVPLFLLVLLALVHPACVAGQSWVAEAYWTNLDEQPPWGVGSEPADPVPTGFGVGIRHLIDSHLFVEAQVSRGADQRLGAICGGASQVLWRSGGVVPRMAAFEAVCSGVVGGPGTEDRRRPPVGGRGWPRHR